MCNVCELSILTKQELIQLFDFEASAQQLRHSKKQQEPADPVPPRMPKRQTEHRCEICNIVFVRAYSLRSHFAVHKSERPYACNKPGCDKTFTRHHDLTRHKQVHETSNRNICKGCGLSFSRLDALHRHFRNEAGKLCVAKLGWILPANTNAVPRKRQSRRYEATPPPIGTGDPSAENQSDSQSMALNNNPENDIKFDPSTISARARRKESNKQYLSAAPSGDQNHALSELDSDVLDLSQFGINLLDDGNDVSMVINESGPFPDRQVSHQNMSRRVDPEILDPALAKLS